MTQPQCVVIPVLDLMIGQVVWARGGDRGNYAPVHSPLVQSARPVDVAQAIFRQTGCRCLYVADIDSFSGARPAWEIFQELTDAGFELWIDADWMTRLEQADPADADRVLELGRQANVRLIISTETIQSLAQLETVSRLVQQGLNPVFSIDINGDQLIARPGELLEITIHELVRTVYAHGVRTLILLDLQSVGNYDGGQLADLIAEISGELPDLHLISGGGIRSTDDVQTLLNAGCDAVLVASAIYDCRITVGDIEGLERSR